MGGGGGGKLPAQLALPKVTSGNTLSHKTPKLKSSVRSQNASGFTLCAGGGGGVDTSLSPPVPTTTLFTATPPQILNPK